MKRMREFVSGEPRTPTLDLRLAFSWATRDLSTTVTGKAFNQPHKCVPKLKIHKDLIGSALYLGIVLNVFKQIINICNCHQRLTDANKHFHKFTGNLRILNTCLKKPFPSLQNSLLAVINQQWWFATTTVSTSTLCLLRVAKLWWQTHNLFATTSNSSNSDSGWITQSNLVKKIIFYFESKLLRALMIERSQVKNPLKLWNPQHITSGFQNKSISGNCPPPPQDLQHASTSTFWVHMLMQQHF